MDEREQKIERAGTLLAACDALLQGKTEECMANAREAYELAQAAGHEGYMGQSLYWMATALRNAGDLTSARPMMQDAIRVLSATDDYRHYARALQGMGSIQSVAGELDAAMKSLDMAAMVCRAHSDIFVLARVLNSRAIVAIRQADYTSALQYFTECQALLAQEPDPYLTASVYLNTSAIYQRMGDFPAALEVLQRAVAVEGRVDDFRFDTNAHTMLATVYSNMARWPEAKASALAALEIAKEQGYLDLEGMAYQALIPVVRHEGDVGSLVIYLQDARDVADATGNKLALQRLETDLATILSEQGHYAEASKAFEHATALAAEMNSPQLVAELEVALVAHCMRAGDLAGAVEHLTKGQAAQRQLLSASNRGATEQLERALLPDRKAEIELVHSIGDELERHRWQVVDSLRGELAECIARTTEKMERYGNVTMPLVAELQTMRYLLEQLFGAVDLSRGEES